MSSHAKDHKVAHGVHCLCPKDKHVNAAAPAELDHELVKVWNTLNEVKCRLSRKSKDGVKEISSIVPEQMLVNETEASFKHNGVWGGSLTKNDVPKGQAIMNELVDQIHEMIESLQSGSSEKHSAAIEAAKPHFYNFSNEYFLLSAL